MVFILSALWWIRITGLWKLPGGRDWLWGTLGLVLMGGAMLSESLIQFSVDGWGCVHSLLFDLRPNYDGGNESNGDFLQKVPCTHCHTQCPWPWSRPPPTNASDRDSWTLTGKSGSVFCGVIAPFSWVLVRTRFSHKYANTAWTVVQRLTGDCFHQYTSKFGKCSSGHKTGKGQFSLKSQRRTMLQNVWTTVQLHSFHMLASLCSKSFKLGFSSMWTENFQMS